MSEWCTCEKCRRRDGNGQVIPRSTWYTHNPGGKKATRLVEHRSRIAPPCRDNISRDNLGSGSSVLLGKRPAEEDAEPPDRAKRVASSDSVRVFELSYLSITLIVSTS